MQNKNTLRLDKYLANAGIVSRRGVDDLVRKKNILINGKAAKESGQRINPEVDQISVQGREIKPSSNLVYVILNKPLNVVSTTKDEDGRETVTDLVNSSVRLYPVGRLDADSIGLILLTNDGELTHKLTHPKFHIDKSYEVLVKDKVNENQLNRLRNGVMLKDGMTAPAKVKILEEFKFTTKIEFLIHEGRNRQIRRMCGKVGLEVLELKRVAIGPIGLGNLKTGGSRPLTESEIRQIKESVAVK